LPKLFNRTIYSDGVGPTTIYAITANTPYCFRLISLLILVNLLWVFRIRCGYELLEEVTTLYRVPPLPPLIHDSCALLYPDTRFIHNALRFAVDSAYTLSTHRRRRRILILFFLV